jgi:hypothetical protein
MGHEHLHDAVGNLRVAFLLNLVFVMIEVAGVSLKTASPSSAMPSTSCCGRHTSPPPLWIIELRGEESVVGPEGR